MSEADIVPALRTPVTLVHEPRRRGGGIGVAAMCGGGTTGSATVIEVSAP